MNDPTLPLLALIGHSHLFSIAGGCEALGFPSDRTTRLSLSPIEEKYLAEGDAAVLAHVRDAIEAHLRGFLGTGPEGALEAHIRDAGLQVLLSLGGNEHNLVGMVNTGGDHDFLWPGEDGALRPGSTIVPFGAVRAMMERHSVYFRDLLEAIVTLTGGRVAFLESPPPIRDSAFVFANLDPIFQATYGDAVTVNPPEFRHKLWRLRCTLFAGHCARLGVPYVAVPRELMQDGRYLRPEALAGDATHANAWFGSIFLQAALDALDAFARRRVPAGEPKAAAGGSGR